MSDAAALALAEHLLADDDLDGARPGGRTLAGALAEIGRRLGDHPGRAAIALARLEELAAAHGSADVAARSVYVRAQATAMTGDLATALELIDLAARRFAEVGLHGGALRTDLGRINVLNETGRHDEALDTCHRLVHVLSTRPPADLSAEEVLELLAAAEQNRGLCCELTGRWLEALEAYARAEAGYARLDDEASIGEVLNNRGLVLLALGRIGEARAAFRSALDKLDADDRPLRAMATNGLAETLLAGGDYVGCLDALADAKELLDDLDAPMPELDRSLAAARAYEALNLSREALANYEEAERFAATGGAAVEAARAVWGAARLRFELGDTERAAADLGRALDAFRQAGHGQWLALALLDRSAMSHREGDVAAALADADEAASISAVSDARIELVRAHLAIAELRDAAGDEAGADAAIAAAVAAGEQVEVAPVSLLVDQAVGRRLLERRDLAAARRCLERAARTAELLHADLDGAVVGQRFMLDKLDAFDALIELALVDPTVADDHRGVEVLAATERARRRRLGELRHRTGAPHAAADDGEVATELDAVYAEMLNPAHGDRERFERLTERAADLELRLSRARLDSARHDRGVGGASPSSTGTAADEPISSDLVLPNGETVLSWYCLADRVLALVIADGLVTVRLVPATRAEVVDAVARLDAQWQHLHADAQLLVRHHDRFERAVRRVLGELHDMLVAPVADLLPTAPAAALVVAAHGPLQQVPVHALHDGERYLIERFTVSTTPSVADYVTRAASKHPGGRSLVIAASDATTPAIDAEGRAVAAHLSDVSLHLGDVATASALLGGASGAAVVHLACHALFRRDNPMFSSLRLADRSIRANELLDLDLTGALVTLSSCDSARSHAGHGEELVGLMRAVLGAGARTLVASLWPADDTTTHRVVDGFYARLRELGPAAALRETQLAQLSQTPHPYYWAPFVVIGGR